MTDQTPKINNLPKIDITERNLPVISEQTWKALIRANSPPRFFYHANRWIRVVPQKNGIVRLEQLDNKKLRHELVRLAQFVFTRKGEIIIDLPSTYLLDDLLADPKPRLPVLIHVASAPIFSKGGHLRVQHGYDLETKCYLMFEGWCRVIGGILKVNGIPGFLENLDTLYTTADMETALWRTFTDNWFFSYAHSSVGVAQLYELVLDKDIPIDLGSGSEHSKRIRLGIQISKMRQRQFGDYRIVPGKEKNHAQTWRLELVG